MIVWLWDTGGPAVSASGVTDSETRAKRAAAEAMRAMSADTATVEAGVLLDGGAWLEAGYRRTGIVWTALAYSSGRIRWRMSHRLELAAAS